MCGLRTHLLVDSDPQNILDLRTDSGFCMREKLQMRTDVDSIPSDLYFYYDASKQEMQVISTYFTQNIVRWLF